LKKEIVYLKEKEKYLIELIKKNKCAECEEKRMKCREKIKKCKTKIKACGCK